MSDRDLQTLVARVAVLDTVVALFVATDERDWRRVESCFAERVLLDMTSLVGGEPTEVTPAEVAAGWRHGLAPMDHVHHQVGNFQVRLHGDDADVACYGVAIHQRDVAPPNTRTFVGSYAIHLRRGAEGWRIDRFRYVSKFATGNLQLEQAQR